jgi:hypothetical protein
MKRFALLFALCMTAALVRAETPTISAPDRKITPGVANPHLTKAVICSPTFRTGLYRHVSVATKRRACKRYKRMDGCPGPSYEIDHVIPLELGGSNAIRNLWPQPVDTPLLIGFHAKDVVEGKAQRAVCSGHLSLRDAQYRISHDWYGLGISIKDE